jgi:hypothetical protein
MGVAGPPASASRNFSSNSRLACCSRESRSFGTDIVDQSSRTKETRARSFCQPGHNERWSDPAPLGKMDRSGRVCAAPLRGRTAMKKGGILNPPICALLAELGQGTSS